jgi:hypothetical protein
MTLQPVTKISTERYFYTECSEKKMHAVEPNTVPALSEALPFREVIAIDTVRKSRCITSSTRIIDAIEQK